MIGHRHFVSNMGKTLEPLAFDGDGFISEIDDTGGLLTTHLSQGCNQATTRPKGLAVVGNLPLVADIDRIVGFDLTTGQTAFQAPMEAGAPSLLNDIAPETDKFKSFAYHTIRGALYRLDLRTRRFTTLATGIPGANGVTINPDGSSAIVVGVGNDFAGGMFTVSLGQTGDPDKWDAPFGMLDGIAILPDGRFVISNWVAADRPVDGQLIVCDGDRRHCRQQSPRSAKRTSGYLVR